MKVIASSIVVLSGSVIVAGGAIGTGTAKDIYEARTPGQFAVAGFVLIAVGLVVFFRRLRSGTDG